MNDLHNDCIRCMEIVTEHRTRSRGYYPLPTATECVRYAVQELGELDDAWMREDNPAHKRNNGREHDWQKELGQVGYMIGSALVNAFRSDWLSEPIESESRTQRWASVLWYLSSAICVTNDFAPEYAHTALKEWVMLCYYLGQEPTHLLLDVCKKIDQKWGEHERQLL